MMRSVTIGLTALALAGVAWPQPSLGQRITPLARGVSGVSPEDAAAIRRALAKAEAEDRDIAKALARAAAEDRASEKALADAEDEGRAAARAAKAEANNRAIAEALAKAEAEDRAADEVAQTKEPEELRPSEAAVRLSNWVISSRDNQALPFIVIDKESASLLVFGTAGEYLGMAPALLGITVGDDSTPGVGDRELNQISIEERTTPAGRFAARYGPAAGGKRVLWVDFSTALALHPVVTANRKEKRLQRINSPTVEDNRITFGCINVPTAFYNDIVFPLFDETGGIVYILPETQPLEFVFPRLPMQLTAPVRIAL